jgi:sugar phosphate isomerase/epimerase
MILSCFSDEIDPSLDVQLKVLSELGMSHLEIRTVNDVNIMDMNDDEILLIRRQCDQRGFIITCVASPIGKEDASLPIDLAASQTRRACQAAKALGCSFIRIFSFFKGELDEEQAFEASRLRLKAMAQEAAKASMTLVMEAGHSTVGAKAETQRRLLEAVELPSLRCAYDPGAFVAEGQRPFEQCFPVLEPYIEYMHIKDARLGQSGRVPAGQGDAQVEEALIRLSSRKGFIASLEPHLAYAGAKRGFSGIEGFKTAYKAVAEILKRNSIEFC